MNEKICCGFGHRDYYGGADSLLAALKYADSKNCTVFQTGGRGAFDRAFSAAVKKLALENPEIRLQLILPYLSAELNNNKAEYERYYDAIILPEAVDGVHFKAAITVRNRWMVDRADLIISGVCRNYGGAYDAVRYAERKGREIVCVRGIKLPFSTEK